MPEKSYIDSPDWLKNKKATIYLINKKGNKCFQYAVTVAINHEEIKKDPKRITKTNSFIYKYNWEGINYLSEKDCWRKIEKNNLAITLHVLHANKEKIYLAFVLKHNSNRENKLCF